LQEPPVSAFRQEESYNLKMEAAGSLKMLVPLWQTIYCHIAEQCYCKNSTVYTTVAGFFDKHINKLSYLSHQLYAYDARVLLVTPHTHYHQVLLLLVEHRASMKSFQALRTPAIPLTSFHDLPVSYFILYYPLPHSLWSTSSSISLRIPI
jgi:hypothetical protein